MKKFIVTLITIVAIFSLTAHAESGDKQFIVIKNGENVTIYTITDKGENMYGNKDASIDVKEFVSPTVRDLRSYDVPEECWRMCGMSENSSYSSNISKLEKTLQETKIDYENENENIKYLEEKLGVYVVVLIVIMVLLILIIIIKQITINKLKG